MLNFISVSILDTFASFPFLYSV